MVYALRELNIKKLSLGAFPVDPVVEKPPANTGDTDLILAAGRSHMTLGN